MSRKTIKCSEATKDRFDEHKRDGETTDGLLNRAFDALEADERRDKYPGAPRCTDCKSIATVWTIEDGSLVCGVCADDDVELPDDYPDHREQVPENEE